MLHIGCHLSIANGYEAMAEDALSIQADTFQFFTRNPRGGTAKELNIPDMTACQKLCRLHHFAPCLAHAPYTLNPCAADERIRNFALRTFAEDLKILENLPGNYYNFHPGCHVGQGTEAGIRLTADMLNRVLKPDLKTKILIETMSGKGSEIGKTFVELREIIAHTDCSDEIGICLDTCHVYSAGYDIVNELDKVIKEFDEILGLERLKAIHLNDSMYPFGSHQDRHAPIGKGTLGSDALKRIVTHPLLKDLPFILETPHKELPEYAEEITFLRS